MSSSPRRVPPSESPYPHDTHPGLVPGVSVEEQRVRYRTDRITFGVAGALIGGLVGNQIGGGNGRKVATVAGAEKVAYCRSLGADHVIDRREHRTYLGSLLGVLTHREAST